MLLPHGEGDSAQLFRLVEQNNGRWLAVAGLFFLASVAMTLGLPCILTLFERKGSRLGIVALVVFSIGCIGTSGYAMLLAFFRALVLTDAIRDEALPAVTHDPGLLLFLYFWVAALYLGELLLAFALMLAKATPRWVPWLLVLHVATLPLSSILPQALRSGSVLLMTVGFAGIAITANSADVQLSYGKPPVGVRRPAWVLRQAHERPEVS
jgi:hypothetical protein